MRSTETLWLRGGGHTDRLDRLPPVVVTNEDNVPVSHGRGSRVHRHAAAVPDFFAALHVAYGNPSPENLVGGFLLGWVYLKSETILLPVLLHSLGNLLVLFCQVAGWYVLKPGL